MPIKHKHSETPGNRANLTPGEIGHNRNEDVLLIRGEDRKLEIDLFDWRHRSLPPGGTLGSPLSRDAGGELVWDAAQLPVGQIGGGFYTDGGQGGIGWGVPGWFSMQNYSNFYPGSITATNLQPGYLWIEDFYVASDKIIVTHLGSRMVWPDSQRPKMRIGLADENGIILADKRNDAVPNNWTEAINPVTLTRGKYSLLIYNDGPVSAPPINLPGSRYNQGFEFSGTTVTFLKRRFASGVSMLSGLYLNNGLVVQEERDTDAGETKAVFMRWLMPIPAGALTGGVASPNNVSGTRVGDGLVTTASTTIAPQGGGGFYTYAWSASGFTVSDPAAATVTFSKQMTGGDNFSGAASVLITDILSGEQVSTTVNVALECQPAVVDGGGGGYHGYPLYVTVSPNGATEYAGPGDTVTVCFDWSVSNGNGDYTYSWGGDGSGCYSTTIPPYATPGQRFEIFGTLGVYDSAGGVGSGGGHVQIVVV